MVQLVIKKKQSFTIWNLSGVADGNQAPHTSRSWKASGHCRLKTHEFLINGLFITGNVKMVYSHIDRIVVAGICTGRGTSAIWKSAEKFSVWIFFWNAGNWELLMSAVPEP